MKAILHIGTEKTGTTSLQGWLSSNQSFLDKKGFYYSKVAGVPNNIRLAAYAEDDSKLDNLRIALKLTDARRIKQFRAELVESLAKEASGISGRTIIFSNEHCQSRLLTVAEVRCLHSLLAGIFDEIQLVVYLRRQDEVATSRYSTMLKSGGTREDIIDFSKAGNAFYDYNSMLDRWATVFGEENLSIRIFDRSKLIGGSITVDFCKRLGFDATESEAIRTNESLRPEYQEFLRRLNFVLPTFIENAPNPERGQIHRIIEQVGSGPGRKPARAEAEAFYRHFRAGNESVRARWFPERDSLFDEDFFSYPEISSPPELEASQLFEMFAEVWGAGERVRKSLFTRLRGLEQKSRRT